MSAPDAESIASALNAFTNTGTPRAAIDAFHEHEKLLISDGALAMLDDNLQRYAGDAEAQGILGLRRRAIVAAREHGSEAGVAELYRETSVEAAVLAVLNAPGFAPTLRALRADSSLLSPDARDYFDFLVARNAADAAALARVRNVRALVSVARERGFESARAWIIKQYIDALNAVDRGGGTVESWTDLLEMLDRPEEALNRAQVQVNVANALRTRARETRDKVQLDLAIGALESALEVLTKEAHPAGYSGCHRVLGNIYSDYDHDGGLLNEDDARRALEHFELALSSVDPADAPNRLHLHFMAARCLERLGRATEAREQQRVALAVVGAASLEQAIALCQELVRQLGGAGVETARDLDAALESLSNRVSRLGGDTEEAARAHYELGNVMRDMQGRGRAMHLDRALAHSQAAAKYFEKRDPDTWAKAEANLGASYVLLMSDERANNLERAIAHLQNALTVHTREAYGQAWAIDSSALASAWLQRKKGNEDDNAQKALDLLAGVIEFWDTHSDPRHASESMNLAGVALERLERRLGPRALDAAAAKFEAALRLAEKFGLATLSSYASNLADLQTRRGQLDEAVATIRRALATVDHVTQSYAWAVVRRNEAVLHSRFEGATAAAHGEEAVRALQECLEIFDSRQYALERRDTQRSLGTMYMRRGQHSDALAAFRDSIDCAERLYARAFTETGRLDEAGSMSPVYRDAAFCLAKLGKPGEALVLHERSRTRVLVDALELGAARFDGLPPEQRAAAEAARADIERLDDEMRRPDDAPGRRNDAVVGRLLQQARDQLGQVLAFTRAAAPSLAELLDCIPPDGALVMPILTAWGGVALVVPGGVTELNTTHVLPVELTSDEINLLLIGTDEQPGLLRAYGDLVNALSSGDVAEQRRALERYRLQIGDTCQALWRALMGPVCERLEELKLRAEAPVLIVPQGSLGLLPLHAAADANAPAFVQRFTPRFAPSLTVLTQIAMRTRATAGRARLLAVSDPRANLPFARLECAEIARLFGADDTDVIAGPAATPTAVARELHSATHVHFACHGFFSWHDATRSGLALADDATLDVAEIVSPRIDLGATRLVTVSACESGLSDYARLPDEYLGLPAALLVAGAPTVVSTLWAVQDRCTSLLMSEFYRRLLGDGTHADAPAKALASAQRWLASLSLAELGSWVERAREQLRDPDSARILATWSGELARLRGLPATTRPYASAYYWAAFTVVGAA